VIMLNTKSPGMRFADDKKRRSGPKSFRQAGRAESGRAMI
jgi:hypothetical protein